MRLTNDSKIQKVLFRTIAQISGLLIFIYLIYINGSAELSSGAILFTTLVLGAGVGFAFRRVEKHRNTNKYKKINILAIFTIFVVFIGLLYTRLVSSYSEILYQLLFGAFGGVIVAELFDYEEGYSL